MRVRLDEIVEIRGHHAGADRAAPAMRIVRRRRMPASRSACSAASSAKRCERLVNFESLRSVTSVLRSP
jgi:hypothetical protein